MLFRQIDSFLQEADIKQVSKWPTLVPANGRIGGAKARDPHDLDVPKHVPLHQCDHSSPQLDTEVRPPQLRPQDRPGWVQALHHQSGARGHVEAGQEDFAGQSAKPEPLRHYGRSGC